MENAVDAGATEIKLIIRDAGKTLIQVVDNGCGMSGRDARMCFERHATSKIQSPNDLLSIRTLGFRGEALASIASIAQVDLRTKRIGDEIGTQLIIEGSEVKNKGPVNTADGTNIQVKNLFWNVPARRNFLKSNISEFRYILEEFYRVALVHPDISFTMYNQDKILFQLPPCQLKQRIVNLLGNSYNQRLIPVEQQTALVNISGFIGKPEFAKKTRGEQYFFTNGRFIRNASLHHAVAAAFRELIPKDSFPTYIIYLELDPAGIDINIHPSKTEINFLDFSDIYAILHAAVKQALGKHNLTPALDFEQETSLDIPPLMPGQFVPPPKITINPDYNPFEKKTDPQPGFRFPVSENHRVPSFGSYTDTTVRSQPGLLPAKPLAEHINTLDNHENEDLGLEPAQESFSIYQVANTYIVTESSKGLMIIDQQAAHERILYEGLLEAKLSNSAESNRIIPATLTFSTDDALMLREHLGEFALLGFEISEFGNNTFILHSIPSNLPASGLNAAVEKALEQMKNDAPLSKESTAAAIAKNISRNLAVRRGKKLRTEEMESIYQKLFACKVPELSPDGKPTLVILGFDDLAKKFKV
jgi:DNA mismatch repair protein MutL